MDNTESIIYQANIRANISSYKEKIYFGVSKTIFYKKTKVMGNYPSSIGSKKTEWNAHNKVENIKEMSLLHSKENNVCYA